MNSELIDWNCGLLSSIRIDVPNSEAEALEALRFMANEYSITRFCMMPLFDARKEPVSVFLLKRAAYIDRLSGAIPKEISVKYASKVLLCKGLSKVPNLEKLAAETGGYLPLMLPITSYEVWIDQELNQLLYKRKLKLLLISCEIYPTIYPAEIVEKLFRMQNTVFLFQYRVFSDVKLSKLVLNMCKLDRSVLFGSEVNNLYKAWNFPLAAYRTQATSLFSKAEMQKLDHFSNVFWSALS